MRTNLIRAILATTCLAVVLIPLPVSAQSDVGLSISTSSTTVNRGSGVGISGLVTNNTSSKMRLTVSISAFSPCGTETAFGEAKISLDAGKSVYLSVYYSIPPDACTGTYAVTISGDSGKGGRAANSTPAPSATTYVQVQ